MKVIKVYYKTTFILGENSAPWRIIHHISPSVSTIKFYQAIKFWKRKRNGKRDKEIKEYTPIAQKLHKQMKTTYFPNLYIIHATRKLLRLRNCSETTR